MADEHHRRTPSSSNTSHRDESRLRDEARFDEDPLVELARIVSDDGGFSAGARSRGQQTHRQGAETNPPDPFAAELEAELMEEVELHRERPPGEAQEPISGEAGGSGHPGEPLEQGGGAPFSLDGGVGGDRYALGPEQHPEPQPPDQHPDADPDAGHAWASHAPDLRGAYDPSHHSAPMPVDETSYGQADEAAYSGEGADYSAERGEAHWQGGHGEADPQYLAETPDSFADDRIAAPSGGEREGFHFDDEHLSAQDEQDESFGSEHAAYGAYSDASPDDLSDYPAADMRRPQGGRRSRKGLLAAAGVLSIVVLGGAGAAWIGMSGTSDGVGPPPVISADAGPLKIPAEPDASEAQNGVGEAVYDRVAGQAVKAEERLVERTEAPQDIARPATPDTTGPAVRLERLPGTEPDDAAAAGSDETPAGAGEDRIAARISAEDVAPTEGPTLDPIGPRRVRTITVRPDGTIVPEAERSAEPAAREPVQLAAPQDEAQAPTPVPVRTLDVGARPEEPGEADGAPERVAAAPIERILEPSAEAGAEAPEPAAPRVPQEETPSDVAESEPAAAEEPAEELVAALPRPRPASVPQPAAAAGPSAPAAQPAQPMQPTQPTQPAQPALPQSTVGDGPVNLLAAAPRPAQPAQPAPPPPRPSAEGGYAVQLSSQRTEDQARASFATLRSQYPSVLGGHQAQIERADLGERGIYYRVRIGMDSQTEAVQLCEELRSAGGNCFVSR